MISSDDNDKYVIDYGAGVADDGETTADATPAKVADDDDNGEVVLEADEAEGEVDADERTDDQAVADEQPLAASGQIIQQATQRLEQVIAYIPQIDRQLEQINAYATQLAEPINLDPFAYQTDAEYQQALAASAARDVQLRRAYADYQQAEQQRGLARREMWDQQSTIGRAKYKDFDTVVSGKNFQPNKAMAEAIISSPAGADIAYHLSKNPQLGARIAALTPMAAAMEIGRLSATIGKAQPAKKVTAAPPPPPTLTGGKAPTKRRASDMTVSELGKLLYN